VEKYFIYILGLESRFFLIEKFDFVNALKIKKINYKVHLQLYIHFNANYFFVHFSALFGIENNFISFTKFDKLFIQEECKFLNFGPRVKDE